MKISQHFLDSMSHTAVVRKWGLSDFAEMVSLRREDWHWIQVLSQRAPKFHAPLCFLAPPLHSSGQTRDRSNAHQMAACHIENQSLKSIFRHVIFFFFFLQDAPLNLIKTQKFRRFTSGTSAAASARRSQWVGGRHLNLTPTLPSLLLRWQRK